MRRLVAFWPSGPAWPQMASLNRHSAIPASPTASSQSRIVPPGVWATICSAPWRSASLPSLLPKAIWLASAPTRI